MGWVRHHLPNGEHVRGIIIGQIISDEIRYAMGDMRNVELREYELALKLRGVAPLVPPQA